jgi:hypothetical protein
LFFFCFFSSFCLQKLFRFGRALSPIPFSSQRMSLLVVAFCFVIYTWILLFFFDERFYLSLDMVCGSLGCSSSDALHACRLVHFGTRFFFLSLKNWSAPLTCNTVTRVRGRELDSSIVLYVIMYIVTVQIYNDC